MISSPELTGISGKYYSGRPGKPEFYSINPSEEASDPKTGEKLWRLTDAVINKNLPKM
jgi:hypothetical protein